MVVWAQEIPLTRVVIPMRRTVRLAEVDNVAVAVESIAAGETIDTGVMATTAVPQGHKIATSRIPAGGVVLKYGQIIGVASTDIDPGAHVHVQNLISGNLDSRLPRTNPPAPQPCNASVSFQGFRRADGRAGTRNQIGVIASVNCSATVVHAIADQAARVLLPRFPNVDGVAPIAHQSGCGIARQDAGFAVLERTMKGFVSHPNFGAVLVVGLGCEVTAAADLLPLGADPARYQSLDIQQIGGTSAAIRAGLERLEALMATADADRRTVIPASELIVGLQCGGSDGFSGITANPAMGMVVDRLIALGGAALLSETPEIYGAEHLLLSRVETAEVGAALRSKIAWWLEYVRANGSELDNNPSPGNKQGGLTTIYEKSLGAIAKAGQSTLRDVIDYGRPLRCHGLVFMDSPGFDPCSATGQVASGANMLLFSTGRGSCFGCKPAPSIKLASNSDVFRRMADDMDIDCGRILSGVRMSQVADEIFETMMAVASGRKSKSEQLGYGDHEFVPWRLGAVL